MKMFRIRAICSAVLGIYGGLADMQFIETITPTFKVETRTVPDLVRAPVRLLGEGGAGGGGATEQNRADLMILVDLNPSPTDLTPFQELGDDISRLCIVDRNLRVAFGTITENLQMSWEFDDAKATDPNAFNGVTLRVMTAGGSNPAEAMKSVPQRFDLTSDTMNIVLLMLTSRQITLEFQEEVANLQHSGITVVVFGLGLTEEPARILLSCPEDGRCQNMYICDSDSFETEAHRLLYDLRMKLIGVSNPEGHLTIIQSSPTGLEGWAIALIVVGSLIAAAIIVAIIVVFIRKRRQNQSS